MPSSVPTFVAFLQGVGPMEWFIIFLIVLVLFGSTRLPQIGRGLGEGIRNFRRSVRATDDDKLGEGGEKS